ncbi:hypothetical protein BGX26_008171 [Mortierella sp. AD094]|nr:hypothetical protein BGX26_008171 [Mortierella sp. AD094]
MPSDNPVRLPPPRQPVYRSKLSMQYTPSESEDSDEEPLSLPEPARRSRFLSGQPVELNSNNSKATESLRAAISRLDLNQATPTAAARPSSVASEKADTVSLSSTTKKRSKSSKKIPAVSNTANTTSSKISRASMESTGETGKHELLPPSGAFHQRSWSSPDARKASSSNNSSTDALNTTGTASPSNRNSIILENRDRKARDSGFEDLEGRSHRRYSSATFVEVVNRPPLLNFNHRPRSSSSLVGGDNMYIDQQQQQQHQQQQAPNSPSFPHSGNSLENIGRSSPQPGTPTDEQFRSRRSTLVDPSMHELPPHVTNTALRRSSAPVITETLVSRIDREKSTVCFQTPSAKREYLREANLDPALSSLVQQHRRDFQVNTRLGGTGVAPQPTPQAQHQQHQHQQQQQVHDLPLAMDYQSGRDRDVRGAASPRRDSGSSQISNSPHHPPVNTGLPTPSTPGMHPLEPNNRRLSDNHHQLPPVAHSVHPAGGKRMSYIGNNSTLLNAAANSSARQQQQQQEQLQRPSPQMTPQLGGHGGQGIHRTSPKRHSSAGYFNLPQHQQQQQSHIQPSPTPSPVLGATSFGYGPELSVAMQYQQQQQQQVQLQIQQQQLQQLQQQQQQQQVYQATVSPLTLLQNPNTTAAVAAAAQQLQLQQQLAVQHQQNQQQLEQLQQIRIQQQQQLILQQQQQLQQQLEQARAAVAVASATLPTPTETSESRATATTQLSQQQQQQQQAVINSLPVHFALPAPPVLTTAMGIGMGMGMNPSSMNMNLMGMGMNPSGGYGPSATTPLMTTTQGMFPQLVMSPHMIPQLTQQLMAFPNTQLYSYQQQQLLASGGMGGIGNGSGGIAAMVPAAPAAGGRASA